MSELIEMIRRNHDPAVPSKRLSIEALVFGDQHLHGSGEIRVRAVDDRAKRVALGN